MGENQENVLISNWKFLSSGYSNHDFLTLKFTEKHLKSEYAK